MIRSAAIAIAALAATSAQAAGQQFDLVCTGTVSGAGERNPQPWSARYAIDIAANAWCEAPCGSPKPFARIEPGRLVLIDMSDRVRDTPEFFAIDRVSGQLEGQEGWPKYYAAHCVMAASTAFPKTQF